MRLPDEYPDLETGQKIVLGMDARGDGGWIAFGEGYDVMDNCDPATVPIAVCKELYERYITKSFGLNNAPLRPWQEPEGAADLLKDLLAKDALLAARWAGDCAGLTDTSHSAFDFAIARILANHAIDICGRTGSSDTYDFIAWALLEEFKHGTAHLPKGQRECQRAAMRVQKSKGADDFDPIDMTPEEEARQDEARAKARMEQELPDYVDGKEPEDDLTILPFPDNLTTLGVIMDGTSQWMRKRAHMVMSPAMPVFAALQLVQVLSGNCFCVGGEVHLSAFTLFIARTGAGKGDMEKRMAEVIDVLGVSDPTRGLPASDAAVISGVNNAAAKNVLYSVGELGLKMQSAAKNEKSQMGGIMAVLMDALTNVIGPFAGLNGRIRKNLELVMPELTETSDVAGIV